MIARSWRRWRRRQQPIVITFDYDGSQVERAFDYAHYFTTLLEGWPQVRSTSSETENQGDNDANPA